MKATTHYHCSRNYRLLKSANMGSNAHDIRIVMIYAVLMISVFLPGKVARLWVLNTEQASFRLAELFLLLITISWSCLIIGKNIARPVRIKLPLEIANVPFFVLCAVACIGIIRESDVSKMASNAPCWLFYFGPMLLVFPVTRSFFGRLDAVRLTAIAKTLLRTLSLVSLILSLFQNVVGSLFGWSYVDTSLFAFVRPRLPFGASVIIAPFLTYGLYIELTRYSDKCLRQRERLNSLGWLLIIVVTFILCLSRAAVVGLMVSLAAYVFFYIAKGYAKLLRVLLLAIVISCVVAHVGLSAFEGGFTISSIVDAEGVQARFMSTRTAIKVWLDHPFFGTSAGKVFPRNLDSMDIEESSDFATALYYRMITYKGEYALYDPHNFYVLLLSEAGVIGFGAFMIWLLTLLFKASKAYRVVVLRSNEHDKKVANYLGALLCGHLSFFVALFGNSSLGFTIRSGTVFWFLFSVILVLARSLMCDPRSSQRRFCSDDT